MSSYDYTSKSGYGRSLGNHRYVTKVEAYVEETRKPAAIRYTYPYYYPVKVENSKEVKPNNNYGRPREVDEFLSKILSEVNGAPPRTISPDSRANWSQHIIPVKVESVGKFRADPWQRDHGSDYKYGRPEVPSEYGVPSRQHGRPPSYDYDHLPQTEYGSPKYQWGRSSYPDHDYAPQRGYIVSDNQLGNPPMKQGSPKNHGVPKSNSPVKAYRSGVYGVPKKERGSSPMKYHTQHDYGVPLNPGTPNNRWGSPPRKTETMESYRVPNSRWGSPPKKSLASVNYGAPNNRWSSPPKMSRVSENYGVPNNQWGSPPKKTQSYGVPNQWGNNLGDSPPKKLSENYGGPNNRWGSPPKKSQASENYGVPSNRWGSPPKKPQAIGNYGSPNNRWGSPPKNPQAMGSPNNQWGSPPKKPLSIGDYGSPNNRWGSPPKKPQAIGNYGNPNNKWDRSKSPGYDHYSTKQSPMKMETPKDNGAPKNQWGNSSKDYGVPNEQWNRPPSHVYDHPNSRSPMKPEPWKDHAVSDNRQHSSPLKAQTHSEYGVPSNQQGRSSSPIYDHQPPQVNCQDGVCTFNDKPKVPYSPYEEPKGNANNYDQHKDYGTDGWRPNPYSIDDQPRNYGSTNQMKPSDYNSPETVASLGKTTNNIGDAMQKLTVSAGGSPEGRPSAAPTPVVGPLEGRNQRP